MKPKIGVILRSDENSTGKNVQIIYQNIYKTIIEYGANPVGIINDNSSLDLINYCDGFILQGGDNVTEFDYNIVRKCYELDIPLFGICLGMQTMGEVFGGILHQTNINDHYSNNNLKLHDITIYKNTKLFDIIKEYNINVNTRHKYELKAINLTVSARSNDGVIEAIEDGQKKFFVGVQWHPEDMVDYDSNSKKLFQYFIEQSKKKS